MENNVGDTIIETAVQLDLYNRSHKGIPGEMEHIKELDHNGLINKHVVERPLEEREQNVSQLRTTIDRLLADGCLIDGADLTNELASFATKVEIQIAQDKKEAQPKQETQQVEVDRTKTARHIRAFAVSAADSDLRRELCHILDVHRSVEGHLRKTKIVGGDGSTMNDLELKKSLLYENLPLHLHFAFGNDMP